MRIDWVIAAVTFLMFLSWAFAYYNFSVFGGAQERAASALRAADEVYYYMTVPTATLPANITMDYPAPGSVVWAYVNWTAESRNSTRVTLSRGPGQGLGCMVSGNNLYWEADLSAGDNVFFIGYADMETPMNCSASLSQPAGNQTTPWAAEPGRAFSRERNAALCAYMNTDPAAAREEMGITYYFRAEVSDGGAAYYCGTQDVPRGSEVFSFPYTGILWEGGYANVTVLLWQ